MNPSDAIRSRVPANEVKPSIESLCQEQRLIYLSKNNGDDFPALEPVDYRYKQGQHLIIVPPISLFKGNLQPGDLISGYLADPKGKGLKMTKRVYGKFSCHPLDSDSPLLQELAQDDEMAKRALSHKGQFMTLSLVEGMAYLSPGEIYTLDKDLNAQFSPTKPNGELRFEHSRNVLMEYLDRKVIFSSLVEGNTYYTLAKADSYKMDHIKAGGLCAFYDGRDNHFESQITILPQEKVAEIHQKLLDTNNAYFKSPENLVALSFYK